MSNSKSSSPPGTALVHFSTVCYPSVLLTRKALTLVSGPCLFGCFSNFLQECMQSFTNQEVTNLYDHRVSVATQGATIIL